MRYNLLNESWLPALYPDGHTKWIRPWEIVGGESPPVGLNPQRADFRAALMEFLVGLLQTTFAPKDMRTRDRMLENPPEREELREAFMTHEPYFNLFGDRPRFLQDLTMGEADNPVRNNVVSLFIEQPGINTLKGNTDLFVKRDQVNTLCPACAAAALYTLQAFAPSGGRGNRTSMRGGGPLSTLAVGKTLWENVWMNVAPYKGSGSVPPTPDKETLKNKVYPWVCPTRTSDNNEKVHPQEMHPLHAFWGMPRRIVLRETEAKGPCDVCGEKHELAVCEFASRPNGYNYGSEWVHPLTPYTIEQNKPPLSIKGRSNIEAYSNWLGLVYSEPADKRYMRAAACVRNVPGKGAKVNAAGYDMDNAKARQWCEHLFPVIVIRGDERLFAQEIRRMVTAADQVRHNLTNALKDALVHEAGKSQAKNDKSLLENAGDRFWAKTEESFYEEAEKFAALSDTAGPERRDELRQNWGRYLVSAAQTLFEQTAGSFRIPAERMERYVNAHNWLQVYNVGNLRKMEMYPPKEAK